jgi:hypothetical protein
LQLDGLSLPNAVGVTGKVNGISEAHILARDRWHRAGMSTCREVCVRNEEKRPANSDVTTRIMAPDNTGQGRNRNYLSCFSVSERDNSFS